MVNTKFLLVPLLCLFLSSCNVDDGYKFESKQLEHTGRAISFVLYPNKMVLAQETKRRNIVRNGEVFGFSLINVKKNTCVVHIVDPAVQYMPEQMGHEITHCLYGNFHPNQE